MPDRIIRAELLTSEAWLGLKDNADRLCYLALILSADTLGNQPAGPHRLVHLWRPYGIDTTEKAAQTLSHLTDAGLTISYPQGGKQYVHIPRFGQSRRWLGRLWPIPEWASKEDKQAYAKKTHADRNGTQAAACEPPLGVGLGVGVGVGLGVNQNRVTGFSSSNAIAREKPPDPTPKPQPETPVDKIGSTIQTMTQPATRKTENDIEAERARQLAFVAAKTKGGLA